MVRIPSIARQAEESANAVWARQTSIRKSVTMHRLMVEAAAHAMTTRDAMLSELMGIPAPAIEDEGQGAT